MSKDTQPVHWERAKSQMTRTAPVRYSFAGVTSPAYVFDQEMLTDNLRLLAQVKDRAGCSILLAQKSYSFYPTYPLIASFLDGTTASGLYEAKLAEEYFPGEVHVFSAGYKEEEMRELVEFADYLVFNSFDQYHKFLPLVQRSGRPIELGLRINPEYSAVATDIYNPAGRFSRLGINYREFCVGVDRYGLESISGLHFHTLCEDNVQPLIQTLDRVKEKFAPWLSQMSWVNFGGGHHITRYDYDLDLLVETIHDFQQTYPVRVYLEPGEAVSLDTGYLVSEVVDLVHNEIDIAILDTSAVCHMPDVLEMPYQPRCFLLDRDYREEGSYQLARQVKLADGPVESGYSYRLAGPTCLAGDIIGDYSFARPLARGDKLVFCDMALYAHVKTNSFNGMPLPNLVLRKPDDSYDLVRGFAYEDFKQRLG